MSARPDGSALCRRCGLCCDGTLHPHTRVGVDETAEVRALGLTVVDEGGQLKFRQPCVMYREAVCSVYSARPHACRTYRCELLKAHERGALSFDDALQHVDRARALQRAVINAVPPGATMASLTDSIGRDWDAGQGPQGTPAEHQASTRWLLAWGTLRRYLQRHFEPARSKA